MKKFLLALFIPFTCQLALSQNRLTGRVSDEKSGELIIGAIIYSPDQSLKTVTNIDGLFTLFLSNKDSISLIVHALGFEDYKFLIPASADSTYAIKLKEKLTHLNEIVVRENSVHSALNEMNIDKKYLETLPAFVGVVDIIKAYQTLPGIQRGKEGSSQLFIRGGSPDQNLFLLDGIPLYNVNHAGGFFSVFDEDAINSISLYKGAFPARFGGRLSSIVDIRQNNGNKNEPVNRFEIGLMVMKYAHEGSLNDKTTFHFSLRRSNLDMIPRLSNLISNGGKFSLGYTFYDFNFKTNTTLSQKDRISISVYSGRDRSFVRAKDKNDHSSFHSLTENKWGNALTSIQWTHVFQNQLFSRYAISSTNYFFKNLLEAQGQENNRSFDDMYQFQSSIHDIIYTGDFEWTLNNQAELRFGTNFTNHHFNPGKFAQTFQNDTLLIKDNFGSEKHINNELSTYVEVMGKFHQLDFNIGLRNISYLTKALIYNATEPRISLSYPLVSNLKLSTSYSRMNQFMHLLSNPGLGLSVDLWVPVTNKIPPQSSNNFTLGLSNIKWNDLTFSTEAYFKTFDDIIDFKQGASFFGDKKDWQDKVEIDGQGKTYGSEFSLARNQGKFTWSASYVLSKNTRTFANLNLGNPFPFRYDRRHVINLSGNYLISGQKNLSFYWTYNSGEPITLSQQAFKVYTLDQFNSSTIKFDYYTAYDFALRNNFRVPAYHRLDIGYNITKETGKAYKTIRIGVYNLYNRKNPYYLFFDKDNTGKTRLYNLTMYPIIPSISWSWKFK